jgi:predicted CopG family antitoxin|tara:strand:- start:11159 stop:11374 length:216 start_codon:yes stop_codon:yes gene_type:complete
MKTIALKEKTFELLQDLKAKEKASSFDELIIEIVREKKKVPRSLFGSLKGKTKRFTSKERQNLWKDKYREW